MRLVVTRLSLSFLCVLSALTLSAQPTPSATTSVPRVVRVSGTFVPANGMAPAPVETITLAIYANDTGGAPLWQETQYVTVDSAGRYTVLLGATQPDGLPLDIFASGEARWVGRRFERVGEQEQQRVNLPSVPYALKAADADTLGGLPPSAYRLAAPAGTDAASVGTSPAAAASRASTPQAVSAGTIGTPGCIGEFANPTDLGCSPMVDVGGAIGLGTSAPFDRFHIRFTNTTGAFTGLAVQNLGSTASSYSGMLFYDQNGALGQFQGFNNSTHEYRINNIATSGSINFMLASSSKFQVRSDGHVNIAGDLYKGGNLFLNTHGLESLGLGRDALASNTGSRDNAVGRLSVGGSGAGNTGSYDNALGSYALSHNTSGASNNAVGDIVLFSNTTGGSNTAIGDSAMVNNVAGSNNTAVGANAGFSVLGDRNIAIGAGAGASLTLSDNIAIGNTGTSGDSGVVRIGGANQTRFFAGGIRGVTTGVANAIAVVIDSNGQLGTVSSSRRFKEDIRDMGDASCALFDLRPVTFRYAKAYDDGGKPIQYGLVAEEVAEVFPDLAVKNAEGGVDTVHYETLSVLLLNEVEKQHRELQQQSDAVRQLQEQNQVLDGAVRLFQEQSRELAERLAALEALVARTTPTDRR